MTRDLRLVTVSVLGLPVPGVKAHLIQPQLRLPAEYFFGFFGIREAFRDVAGTSGLDDIGDLDAVDALKRLDDIEHAVTGSGAEVDDLGAEVVLGILDRLDVSLCQIDHVDVWWDNRRRTRRAAPVFRRLPG